MQYNKNHLSTEISLFKENYGYKKTDGVVRKNAQNNIFDLMKIRHFDECMRV